MDEPRKPDGVGPDEANPFFERGWNAALEAAAQMFEYKSPGLLESGVGIGQQLRKMRRGVHNDLGRY